MWLVLTLLLSLTLTLGYEVEPGCDDWTFDPSSSSSVCCMRCKPGNHIVSKCGSDPKALCKPCEKGTYASTFTTSVCTRCTQCQTQQRVKKLCTARSDTVCECVEGFQCGDASCSFCIQLCGKGEEPTKNGGCRSCPAGTFNSQLHQHCIRWSSSCPSPDQQIVAAGTAVSDIVCAERKPKKLTTPTSDVKPTEVPSVTDSKDPYAGLTLVIAVVCACLIISSATPLCVAMYFKKEKMVMMPPMPEETPAAGQRLVPEPEQYSFCFPQQERCNCPSLLLNDKPFELVV